MNEINLDLRIILIFLYKDLFLLVYCSYNMDSIIQTLLNSMIKKPHLNKNTYSELVCAY